VQDRESIEAELERVKPTHVLNAAGVTGRPNVDWCETHKLETIRSNVVGTLTLADCCEARGIHMTNFATGCIFEYDEAHPLGSGKGFTETDEANFTGSFYSFTKAMVESLVKNYSHVLTLRVRMPITSDLASARNFVYKIANYERVVDVPNSMTILDEMLPYSIEMAKRRLTGVYNFTNPGTISHNEVLAMYKQYVDPNYTWKNFSLEEQALILAAPRSNNELDASKLKAQFPHMRNIKESFEQLVFKPYVANGGKPITRLPRAPTPSSVALAPESPAAAAAASSGRPKFLVFGRTGWIGGLLLDLLAAEGADYEVATCRLQVRGQCHPSL
jgi:3,5-epimerase/4-reductase